MRWTRIITDQPIRPAKMIEQIDVVYRFDQFRNGGEMIEVFFGELFFFDFADEHAHAAAAFDQLADELEKIFGRPALGRRAAAGMDAKRAFGRAFVSDA